MICISKKKKKGHEKEGLTLEGRALSYLFIKMGCSEGLTLVILVAYNI